MELLVLQLMAQLSALLVCRKIADDDLQKLVVWELRILRYNLHAARLYAYGSSKIALFFW